MKRFVKKYFISFCLIMVIICSAFSIVSSAVTTTDYGLTSGCDYTVLYSWDTEEYARTAMYNINTIPTYLCYLDRSQPASVSYNKLSGKSFYLFVGHGNNGLISFFDGGSSSYITGKYSGNNYYAINNLNLNAMKVVAYISCNSAGTSTTYGNLLTYSVNKGASSALGFSTTIDMIPSQYFVNKFTSKLANGKTVSSAASSAKNSVLLNTFSYHGMNNYLISGNTSTKLY